MRVVATVLSCAALLSCSIGPDDPKSPLLGEAVRAPDIVWSAETLDCRRIASEDGRLDALSKANGIERHRLVRERNIFLVQWLIPYYGWVATARAGMLDDEIKRVDIVIEDAGDRRLELEQLALAENCAGMTAKLLDATAVAPAPAAPPPPRRSQQDAPPQPRRTATPPTAPASAAPMSAAPVSQSGPRTEGGSVILPLGPGADVDRAAAAITSALQQR